MLRREVDKQSTATLCHLYQSVTYDYWFIDTLLMCIQPLRFQVSKILSIGEQARHPAPGTLGMLQKHSIQAKAESL